MPTIIKFLLDNLPLINSTNLPKILAMKLSFQKATNNWHQSICTTNRTIDTTNAATLPTITVKIDSTDTLVKIHDTQATILPESLSLTTKLAMHKTEF
jgi:hypothetical protein